MRLNMKMTLGETYTVMAEGNPGAMTAMTELVKDDPSFGLIYLAHLDDMEIYGAHIWVGYKDICKFDVDMFRKKILDHSIKDEINDLPQKRLQKTGGIRVFAGDKEI